MVNVVSGRKTRRVKPFIPQEKKTTQKIKEAVGSTGH